MTTNKVGGCKYRSEETREKISNSLKGKYAGKNSWVNGTHRTKETKKKISNSLKGKPKSEEAKRKQSRTTKGKRHPNQSGRKHPMFGKHQSEEAKKKISKGLRGKYIGANSANWKGGAVLFILRIRNCFKYRQWRSDVFTRDSFICQKCGQVGGKLNAHHIESFSSIIQKYEIISFEEALDCEELWNINNGITYCEECHLRVRKVGEEDDDD